MFDLFGSARHVDAQLGELRRSRGAWRGRIDVAHGSTVPLILAGTRAAPDAEALRLARTIAADMPGWLPHIAKALHEHYLPYAEALAAGGEEPPVSGLPKIERADDVWANTAIEYIAVTPLGGALTIEVGYRAAWDEEHTLGARLRDGKLLELNGSVLPP